MTRKTIFIAALAAAMALPAAASANCGTLQGSFAVTCEQGVQVYRHQALSSIPRGISQAQAQLEGEKIRAKTAQRAAILNFAAESWRSKIIAPVFLMRIYAIGDAALA